MVTAAAVDKALRVLRLVELHRREVAAVLVVAAVKAARALQQARRFLHCQLAVEVLKPVEPAVAEATAPDNPWLLLQSNGSFTSKVMARTAKERQFTMSPMGKSKTSASIIAPLSEHGPPVRQKDRLS